MFTSLPPVGRGGGTYSVGVGVTVVGLASLSLANTKIRTTQRMMIATTTATITVIILHLVELKWKKRKCSLHLIGLQKHSDFTWISLAPIFCQWVRCSLRSWWEWKSVVVVFGSRDARSGLGGDKLRCSLLCRRQGSTLGIKTPSVALASVSPKMKIKEYARFEY